MLTLSLNNDFTFEMAPPQKAFPVLAQFHVGPWMDGQDVGGLEGWEKQGHHFLGNKRSRLFSFSLVFPISRFIPL